MKVQPEEVHCLHDRKKNYLQKILKLYVLFYHSIFNEPAIDSINYLLYVPNGEPDSDSSLRSINNHFTWG